MVQQVINIGNTANDGTGDDARQGGAKINANFDELFTRVTDLESDLTSIEYGQLVGLPTLGSAASRDVGTSPGQVIEVLTDNKLPALDASNLYNVPGGGGGGGGGGVDVAGTPTGGQISRFVDADTIEGVDLDYTMVSGLGTSAVLDTGTSDGNVVIVQAGGKLPALDGSDLTNIGGGNVDSVNGQTGVVVLDAADVGAADESVTITVGTGLTGGGDLTDDRVINLATETIDSLAAADAALPNTPSAFRGAFEVASADGTEGPLVGDAVMASLTSGDASDALTRINDLAIAAEVSLIAIPYVGGSPQTISESGVPVVSANLDTNIWSGSLAESTDIVVEPNAFFISDGSGDAITAPPSSAFSLMETGRPFTSRVTNISGSNVLTLAPQDGRRITSSTPSANFTLAASSWDNINEYMEDVILVVPSGATPYDMDVEVGGNGLYVYGTTFPLTLTASARAKFALGKEDGNVPSITYLGTGAPTASVASFITNSYVGSATATMPTHQAGDLLVAYSVYFGGGTVPALPAGWTDGGISQDSNAPTSRVCWKVAADGATAAPVLTGGTKTYVFVYRKTIGSPSWGGSVLWETTAFTAGDAQWPSIVMPQKGLITGIHNTVSTDTGALRADLTVVPNPDGGTSNRTYAGVSALQNAGTWPESTSTKTGGTGRHSVVEWYVY